MDREKSAAVDAVLDLEETAGEALKDRLVQADVWSATDRLKQLPAARGPWTPTPHAHLTEERSVPNARTK